MGRKIDLVVTHTTPTAEAVIVTDQTQVTVGEQVKEAPRAIPRIAYEDIGGLRPVIQKVREMIELPLRHPELFERLGVEAPKGVLLHGPPGTGKTLLAKAVASETNANFHSISGPEIMSKFYGQSEENLRDIFKQAEENAPSIIFIDELDSIAPKRDEVTGEVERRVVAQLLALMDGFRPAGRSWSSARRTDRTPSTRPCAGRGASTARSRSGSPTATGGWRSSRSTRGACPSRRMSTCPNSRASPTGTSARTCPPSARRPRCDRSGGSSPRSTSRSTTSRPTCSIDSRAPATTSSRPIGSSSRRRCARCSSRSRTSDGTTSAASTRRSKSCGR